MELMSFIHKHLGLYKQKGSEISIKVCPFCKGGSTGKDYYTFSINQDKLLYKCLRGKCNKKGHFNSLLEHFGEKRINDINFTNNAVKSVVNIFKNPTDKKVDTKKDLLYKFFAKRKINKETVDFFKCYLDEKNNVVFPYFENKKQVMSKYRSLRPNPKMKSWKNEGGKPILFNWDNVNFNETLYITEGEIDAMTLYQAGFNNVVSIPLGANNFEFIEFHYEELNKMKNVCIWFDNDIAGKQARKTLMKKIKPKHLTWIESSFKDANDILMKHGENKVVEESLKYKEFIEAGIVDLSEVKDEVTEEQYHIKTNIKAIDNNIIGFYLSKYIIITGDSGSGKSTLMNQLALEFTQQNEKITFFSGELTKVELKSWLVKQAVNQEDLYSYYSEIAQRKIVKVKDIQKSKINKWIKGKIFLYDADDINDFNSFDIDVILKKFEFCYRKFDCKYFVLDNFMTLEISQGNNSFEKEAIASKKIKQFCKKNGVTVFVVAHPNKNESKSGFLNKNNISGNKAMTNYADLIIAINNITEQMKSQNDKLFNYSVILDILKNRMFKSEKKIPLCFDPKVKRFHEYEIGSNVHYDWRKL